MKYIKFILIIIILIVNIACTNNVYAAGQFSYDLDEFGSKEIESPTFDALVNNVISIIQVVGSIVSVITLVVIGIQYMYGSIESRAEYKKTMMPYIIGAIMVFGISNITGILYNVAKNTF